MTAPAYPSRTWLVTLTYVAGLSSLLVSYARARAEGLGLESKSGLMARPERVLLLAAGLILGGASWLLWTIGILAVTSTYTAIQRIFAVWRTIQRGAATASVTRSEPSWRHDTAAGAMDAYDDRTGNGSGDAQDRAGHVRELDVSSGVGPRKPGSAPR